MDVEGLERLWLMRSPGSVTNAALPPIPVRGATAAGSAAWKSITSRLGWTRMTASAWPGTPQSACLVAIAR